MPLNPTQETSLSRIDPPRRASWRTGLIIAIAALVTVFAGRGLAEIWIRGMAAESLQRGALSDARRWLARGERLSLASAKSHLLLARIHRQLGHRERWETVLDEFDDSAADSDLQLERRLGAIRWGEARSTGSNELDRLIAQGADRDDAAVSLVIGLLETGNRAAAERVLREWEDGTQWPGQIAWARGLMQHQSQELGAAQEHFEEALALEPGHDNARLGLGRTLEHLQMLPSAAERFAEHLRRWPSSEAALLGLSRCSRRLGHIKLADALMGDAIALGNPSLPVWYEAAEVAYLSGDYDEAIRRFEMTNLEGPQVASTLLTAATAMALAGRADQSHTLFNRYLATHRLVSRRETLEARVRQDVSDTVAAEELRRVMAGEYVPLAEQPQPPPPVSALFSQHCAACHGESGQGDGPANRHLHPPARNLRWDPYRLVSTLNRFPSQNDIRAVIRRGIPGTSMPAFPELSEAEVDQLGGETYRLRQEGFRHHLVEAFRQLGGELDPQAMEGVMSRSGTAGPSIDLPPWPSIGPDQLAIGRSLFNEAACDRCHGEDGTGDHELQQLDSRGNPTIARNLVNDPMKGGNERESLFARLRLGMPGTPHPANPTLSDEQIAYLVEYCLSLAQPPPRETTNYERARRVNQHALQTMD